MEREQTTIRLPVELNENGREGYSAEVAQKAFQDSLKRRGRKPPAII